MVPTLISCPRRLLSHLGLSANGWPCSGLSPAVRPSVQEAEPLPGSQGGSESTLHLQWDLDHRPPSLIASQGLARSPQALCRLLPQRPVTRCDQLYFTHKTAATQLTEVKARAYLWSTMWTHLTPARLMTCSPVHEEAEGPRHKVGDVVALQTAPHREGALLFPKNLPRAPLSRVTLELFKFLFSDY